MYNVFFNPSPLCSLVSLNSQIIFYHIKTTTVSDGYETEICKKNGAISVNRAQILSMQLLKFYRNLNQ